MSAGCSRRRMLRRLLCRRRKKWAKKGQTSPRSKPSPIPAPALTLNKSPKTPEIAPQKNTEPTTVAKNEKPPVPVTTNSPSVEMPSAANALPSETRAPLPKEPETTTQAASSPANSPVPSTAMTQQSPATEPATSNAVTQQSPANSPATKAPAPVTTTVATTPATVLAPATIDSSKTLPSEGFNAQTLLFAVLLGGGILILVWVGYTEFRRRVSVSAYRSPEPASGPRFDSVEAEPAGEKMAAPKRLAGGPPQISLHLKASEPSVRRGAVPFTKQNRPFGTNGGATVGALVENLVPRAAEPAPVEIPEVKAVETPVIEPVAEIVPEPEKAAELKPESVFENISAPITEMTEFSRVGEPQGIESVEEIAPKEEAAPVWTEPAPTWSPTPEPAWTPVAFETAAPLFAAPTPEPDPVA